MNIEKLTVFYTIYSTFLTKNYLANPDDYCFPYEDIPLVLSRMKTAIEKGSFNKDSKSFRDTCRILGIPHTYKAINQYLER